MHQETHDECACYVALNNIDGIGAVTAKALIRRFGDLKSVFAAGAAVLTAAGLSEPQARAVAEFDWADVERELQWARQPQRHILTLSDAGYPSLLAEIVSPPLVLFVMGDISILRRRALAVIGSRRPTPVGRENAERFAADLARRGFVVVGGLAYGIDAAGHLGAMRHGTTVAVLGHGLSRIYPSRHRRLAQQIVSQGGALVSEFNLRVPPVAKNFPRRNRIISGLSEGVLVVEATRRSGSLISARYAAEQGREVFAVPGSIHNPAARGCHYLIRQGAKLAETSADVLEELSAYDDAATHADVMPADVDDKALDDDARQVLACLDDAAVPLAMIVERSGLSEAQVLTALLTLQVREMAQHTLGGYVRMSTHGQA